MAYRLNKPLPLITKRMTFNDPPQPPKPIITKRIAFTSSYIERNVRERLSKTSEQADGWAINTVSPGIPEGQAPTPEEDKIPNVQDVTRISSSAQPEVILSTETAPQKDPRTTKRPTAPCSTITTTQIQSEQETTTSRQATIGSRERSTTSSSRAQRLRATLLLPEPGGVPIPKPPGEAGHPNNGGYSLESTLITAHGWSKMIYDLINSQTKALAQGLLDGTKNYKDQEEPLKTEICDLLTADFSFLSDYVECWPVRDMLKAHLKNRPRKSAGKRKGAAPAN
ncbi:hypothetical protein VNI00_002496 [Paramarasmius palmivorus]|uniref:Uncharacterized protein n=1 Tax=Paramarasmius palmivorus TaxID=297713 RepID=A0AAW0DZM3_9AGAR